MIIKEGKYGDNVIIGDVNSVDFSIVQNHKMFNILSDKLYTNKILAVIRELSTNAYDSHIDAGKKNVPIHIHVPTHNELYFSVTDYGIGMDWDDIGKIYSVCGMSIRDKSNKFVGCMGLGSKSPFAYTHQFQIIAIKNGIKCTCVAMKSSGIPSIVKFESTETTEPNGVTIRIDVKAEDVGQFQNECKKFYRMFRPYPNITNLKWDKDDDHKLVVEEQWKNISIIRSTSLDMGSNYISREHQSGAVRMGNVTYIVPHFPIICQHNMLFLIDAKIGEFDVVVSRESLEKTEANIERIQKHCDNFLQYVNEKCKEVLDKNLLEKIKVYSYFDNLISKSAQPADMTTLREQLIYTPVHSEKQLNKKENVICRISNHSMKWDKRTDFVSLVSLLNGGNVKKYIYVYCKKRMSVKNFRNDFLDQLTVEDRKNFDHDQTMVHILDENLVEIIKDYATVFTIKNKKSSGGYQTNYERSIYQINKCNGVLRKKLCPTRIKNNLIAEKRDCRIMFTLDFYNNNQALVSYLYNKFCDSYDTNRMGMYVFRNGIYKNYHDCGIWPEFNMMSKEKKVYFKKNLLRFYYKTHQLSDHYKIKALFDILQKAGRINDKFYRFVKNYIQYTEKPISIEDNIYFSILMHEQDNCKNFTKVHYEDFMITLKQSMPLLRTMLDIRMDKAVEQQLIEFVKKIKPIKVETKNDQKN